MLNLKELEKKLNKALVKETRESLYNWLIEKRTVSRRELLKSDENQLRK